MVLCQAVWPWATQSLFLGLQFPVLEIQMAGLDGSWGPFPFWPCEEERRGLTQQTTGTWRNDPGTSHGTWWPPVSQAPGVCQALHCKAKHFLPLSHFTLPTLGDIVIPISQMRDWGPERLGSLPKITQLMDDKASLLTQGVRSDPRPGRREGRVSNKAQAAS